MTNSHMLIKLINFESAWGYQPGLAIYLSPLYNFIDPEASLDYLGFAIGLVLLLYFLILLDVVKRYLSLFFIVIFTLPVFLQNQNYLIGLSNNQFFILYIPLVIFLIYRLKEENSESKLNILLLSIILLSITITNPSVSLYIGYALLIYLITLPFLFRLSIRKIIFILFIYIMGVGLYIFNLRMSPSSTLAFLADNSFQQETNASPTDNLSLFLWDIIKIKFFENPFDSLFIAAGYLVLLSVLAICIYSVIKRKLLYFLFSSSGLLFGISTLTGVGQYSFIMGRVGWYYIEVFIILTCLLLSKFVTEFKAQVPFLILTIPIIIFNSLNPPKEYRFDNEEIHLKINNLAKNSKNTLYLFSTLYDNRIYHFKKDVILINDPQLPLGDYSVENLNKFLENCKSQSCGTTLVVIDKNSKLPDPSLSRSINKEVIKDQQVLATFYENRIRTVKTNIELEQTLISTGFNFYFNDSNYSILIKY